MLGKIVRFALQVCELMCEVMYETYNFVLLVNLLDIAFNSSVCPVYRLFHALLKSICTSSE